MTATKCRCGLPMIVERDVAQCEHCDRVCKVPKVKDCPHCQAIGAQS